ncbi:MAG: histidine phosphatase family protein, partial [Cyanobacteria bacterium J06631_2]
MATRVIIVRHGQSTYNAQKIIQGRWDKSVLTDNGISDAQPLGRASCRASGGAWGGGGG